MGMAHFGVPEICVSHVDQSYVAVQKLKSWSSFPKQILWVLSHRDDASHTILHLKIQLYSSSFFI